MIPEGFIFLNEQKQHNPKKKAIKDVEAEEYNTCNLICFQ